MTLDEMRETLRTFTVGKEDEDGTRVLDITPRTHPDLFNSLWSIARPGADTGILTDRHIEAIRLYVGQWGDEDALALISKAYLDMALNAEPSEEDMAAVAGMLA